MAAERGVQARVLDLRWLAPLAVDEILAAIASCDRVLIVDECRGTGSQSEAIATLIRETKGDDDLAAFKAASALSMPGWLLVTCQRSDDQLREREDYAAVCCAIQNLTLYLSEADVACKWTTGLVTRDQRFFDLMGIDSTQEFVAGLIWYGYPKTLPTQSRKPVEDITTETD